MLLTELFCRATVIKGVILMEKKGKVIIAVAITATALAVGTAAATVVICRRIYEKHYFTVSD